MVYLCGLVVDVRMYGRKEMHISVTVHFWGGRGREVGGFFPFPDHFLSELSPFVLSTVGCFVCFVYLTCTVCRLNFFAE